jgi:hypothetical protein
MSADFTPLLPAGFKTELDKVIPPTNRFQYRLYNNGWPVRGTVPTGTIVVWIKTNPAEPNPTVGGNYMAANDLALLAQA